MTILSVARSSIFRRGLTGGAISLSGWPILVLWAPPNDVFDTAIWTPEVLERRYGAELVSNYAPFASFQRRVWLISLAYLVVGSILFLAARFGRSRLDHEV